LALYLIILQSGYVYTGKVNNTGESICQHGEMIEIVLDKVLLWVKYLSPKQF